MLWAISNNMHMLIAEYAIASAKLKLSNELECGGIYGMMYNTNLPTYI